MRTQSPSRLMLYAAISAVETDLRRFISEHTPSADPREFFGPTLYDTYLERATEQEDTPSSTTVTDLLPYADFADHFELINANRALFPSALASHVKHLTPDLARLSPIRNRVMHSRPLKPSDLPTILAFLERLDQAPAGLWTAASHTLSLFSTDPTAIYDLRIPVLPEPATHVAQNLPSPDFDETGFIGRDDFVQRTIDAVFGPYPVITILGAGGIGKSAVALKVAYDILDLPDGPFELIVWSSSKTHTLSGTRIQRITDSIVSSLDLISNVADDLGRIGADPVEGLLEDLAAVPTLLILDNLETVLDDRIRAFLSRLPSGSKVLVTSRIGLGAFEYPLQLGAMDRDETIALMRALARVRGVQGLVKCSNQELREYTARLYDNPGFVKWFVAGAQAGTPPEDLLANPDPFLDFCLTNVYGHLTHDAKAALRCLVFSPASSRGDTRADIGYYSGLEGLRLTEAINGLLSTNMVSTRFVPEGMTYDTCYEVADIAEEYLRKNHPISLEDLEIIEERRRHIVAAGEAITAVRRHDPYQRSALFVRSRRDIVPAKYLREALQLSRRGDYEDAGAALERAAGVAPEYFEVYRVKGVISAEAGKILEAESAFANALEFKQDYGPLLYGYAGFLIHHRDDMERAAEFLARAQDADPEVPVVRMELGRVRLYVEDFGGAREALRPLQDGLDRLSVQDAQKSVDLYLQTFLREGDVAARRRDFLGGLVAFEKGWEFWETIPKALIDRRLRRRLRKAAIAAGWMVEGLVGESAREIARARSVKDWLTNEGLLVPGRGHASRTGADIVHGKVTSLPVREQYGFIEASDGATVFFHKSALQDAAAWEELSVGAGLSFRVETDQEGRTRAIDVRVEHPGHVLREKEGRELDGMVTSLLRNHGFGFVRALEGPSYFFHRSFTDDWLSLAEGGAVSFVVGVNPRDGAICARRVRVR